MHSLSFDHIALDRLRQLYHGVFFSFHCFFFIFLFVCNYLLMYYNGIYVFISYMFPFVVSLVERQSGKEPKREKRPRAADHFSLRPAFTLRYGMKEQLLREPRRRGSERRATRRQQAGGRRREKCAHGREEGHTPNRSVYFPFLSMFPFSFSLSFYFPFLFPKR